MEVFKIEPYINGVKSSAIQSQKIIQTNDHGNFEIYENPQPFSELVKQHDPAAKRLGQSKITAILNTLIRFSKTASSTTIDLVKYTRVTSTLENSTAQISGPFDFCPLSDENLMLNFNELCRAVSYGRIVTVVIDLSKELVQTVGLLKLIYPIIEEGRMNLIIKNGLNLRPAADLIAIRQPAIPTFVVFRESDCVSAIESLPDVLDESGYKNCLFLVHESQIKAVKELFDQLWPKICSNYVSGALKPHYTYEVVNYDLDTILDNNRDEKMVDSSKINILAFRDKFDAVKLLNHCGQLPFVSIWSKNLDVSSYLAENLTSTNMCWYNTVLGFRNYSPSIPHFDFLNSKPVDKLRCYRGSILNLETKELSDIKVVSSWQEEKKKKKDARSMLSVVVTALESKEFPEESSVFEYLNDFQRRLVTRHETNQGTFITKRRPVGFVLLVIDDDEDLLLVFNLIVSCILSENFVYISFKEGLPNCMRIVEFLESFAGYDVICRVDRAGDLQDERLKNFIYYENKHLGSMIKCSEQKLSNSFHHLDGLLFESMTVFKPKLVTDNTI